jgi:cell division septal protein FtsQ
MFLFKRKRRRNRRVWRESYLLETKLPLRSRFSRQREWAMRVAPMAGVVLVCAAIGLGGAHFARQKLVLENSDFTIRAVEAKSDGIIPPTEIARWSGARAGQNLASVDAVGIKRRLESAGMIREAQVRKAFPDRLIIGVNERVAVAQITPTGTTAAYFVDAEGVAFTALRGANGSIISPTNTRRLVTVTGVAKEKIASGRKVAGAEVTQAIAAIRVAEKIGLTALMDLRFVDVSQPNVLRLVSARGGSVWLEPQDLENQLQRLHVIVWRAKSERREVRTADLRGSRTAAVTYF